MVGANPTVSIIVPTYREVGNIPELVERVFAACWESRIDAELILVDDDSRDGTENLAERLNRDYPVRLIVRKQDRGLSSAVLEGLRQARGSLFVVLDADLQHPPERIPALVKTLQEGGCDFVTATRYAAGGSIHERWPLGRRWASRLATLAAQPIMPVSDPMSGFFGLTREVWQRGAAQLNPIGYKIALELYVKCGCRRPAEVPIAFGTRRAGESKAGLREGWRYLRHLIRLYLFRLRHREPRSS